MEIIDKNELINSIVTTMITTISAEQLSVLRDTLFLKLNSVKIYREDTSLTTQEDNNYYIYGLYLQAKLSTNSIDDKTMKQYSYRMRDFFGKVNKPFAQITTEDIQLYLAMERQKGGRSKDGKKKSSSMNNIRNIISSFFEWATDNDYIEKNPMKKIERYKVEKTMKIPFSEDSVTSLKDNCKTIREKALVDLLNSSAARIGEIVKMNIADVNFSKKEILVVGKGNKERFIQFDSATYVHLREYLDSRTDDNPALFVSEREPHERMTSSGLSKNLKAIAKDAHVDMCHAHRFRRTGATRMLNSDVPIDVVQKLLGHESISTTQIYAETSSEKARYYYDRVYS